MTYPLCKGLVTSERMEATADVRVRNMCTIIKNRSPVRPSLARDKVNKDEILREHRLSWR